MTREQDLEVIVGEGRRIGAIARSAPDRSVPHYPDWTLRDLVIHTGSVHARTIVVFRELPQERIPRPELPPGVDPFDWYEATLDGMVEAMRVTDPDAAAWTMVDGARVGWWVRRMVVETGVHRWDAEGALADPEPLLVDVSVHGLDEFETFYLPRLPDVPTLELVATDLDRTWRYGEGAAEATVRGTASDLFLRLMSRPGVSLPPPWEAAVDGLDRPTR